MPDFEYLLALPDTTRIAQVPTETLDTVYRGTIATDPWNAITVGGAVIWEKLAADGNRAAVVASGVKLAGSADSGDTWALLTDAPANVAGLYNLNGSLWGLLDDGRLLDFDATASNYTTISPGGSANASNNSGMAASPSEFVAVAGSPMSYSRSTDGGSTWSAWTASGVGTAVNGLAYGAGRFVAAGATGATAVSTDGGVTWSVAAQGPAPADAFYIANPSILAAVGMGGADDFVLLVSQHTAAANHRHLLYKIDGGGTVNFITDTFIPPDGRAGGYNQTAYMLEYTVGGQGTQNIIRNHLANGDGVLTPQNIIWTPQSTALWFGLRGFFYAYGGANPEMNDEVNFTDDHDDGFQVYNPWHRRTPASIKALAVVQRSVMPRAVIQEFPRYENYY